MSGRFRITLHGPGRRRVLGEMTLDEASVMLAREGLDLPAAGHDVFAEDGNGPVFHFAPGFSDWSGGWEPV
ncbi:hypothetical protein [Arenibaculum pallidiluteum]|uniref:hypothetical protein n=1 Tax=Arenibaculum pallidiluteum TaxID=2812559 RepID=UPI001A960AA1|nr:hypothetical protein [Arenibaculum pallidiluteum]